ncbi:DUF4956 domain-containing protein [Bacteroidota bacterium]
MPEYFSDFSNYELPTFGAAVFSLLLSFILSALIALTYRYTSRGEYSKNFFQALVLSSVVAATIMMAIGDSLAHGIGMIGALAIIRFRNRIRAPRNLIFIFSTLAVGIAAGVYGYTIAVAGTMVFCFVTLVLHFSPYGKSTNIQINFSFQMSDDSVLSRVESVIQQLSIKNKLLNITFNNELIKYEYRIILNEGIAQENFFNAVKNIEGISNVRVNASSNIDRI